MEATIAGGTIYGQVLRKAGNWRVDGLEWTDPLSG